MGNIALAATIRAAALLWIIAAALRDPAPEWAQADAFTGTAMQPRHD